MGKLSLPDMKVSVNWLKEYVDLPDDLSALGERLTLSGVEVVGFEPFLPYPKIVAARVLDVSKHSDADKLWVVKVTTGDSVRTIVCGAPNVVVGMIAPLALPGAILPNGLEILERAVRGIVSEGMLCAEDELGLGPDHSGILSLPTETLLGEPLEILNQERDLVMELELTPNRPDLYCVVGVAREIAGLYGREFRNPLDGIKKIKSSDSAIKAFSEVPVEICPAYNLAYLSDVKNLTSPAWLQNRLLASGLRPISFLVDVSNYVLLWLGQPLHIFDAEKLQKKELGARYAKGGDYLIGLDNHKYILREGDLVIGEKNGANHILAGIIGDEISAVSATTTEIIIEAAIFDPATIQKSSAFHGLKTDSSRSFARGLPNLLPEQALATAITLIQEIVGGKVLGTSQIEPNKDKDLEIKTSADFISNRLGQAVSAKEIKNILEPFGFSVSVKSDKINVVSPWPRLDLKEDYDLVEEVGRVLGYEKLPRAPLSGVLKSGADSPIFAFKKNLSRQLLSAGFSEYLTYSFCSQKLADVWSELLEIKPSGFFTLVNPLNEDQTCLRSSVSQTLASQVLKYQHFYEELFAFEIGKVWRETPTSNNQQTTNNSRQKIQNSEVWSLGLVIQKGKSDSEEAIQYLLGVVQSLLGNYGEVEISSQGNILWQGQKIGWLKNLDGVVAEYLKVRRGTAVAEINLEKLLDSKFLKQFKNIGELPEVSRDLSLVGPETSLAESYLPLMNGLPYLQSHQLLDRYHLGDGQVVMTWRLIFQTDEKTLTAEEVEEIINGFLEKMESLGWRKK